jgi:hypothetical protein
MTTTNSQRITRLMAAHEAMVPYWKDGAFNDAPAALASEYADALLGAPASYWAAVDRLDPSVAPAMIAWARGHVERRDYPEFFAMLAEIGRIRDEQGEDAAAGPEHAELFMKMMRAAPPRYWARRRPWRPMCCRPQHTLMATASRFTAPSRLPTRWGCPWRPSRRASSTWRKWASRMDCTQVRCIRFSEISPAPPSPPPCGLFVGPSAPGPVKTCHQNLKKPEVF